jgi:hypothetical protein
MVWHLLATDAIKKLLMSWIAKAGKFFREHLVDNQNHRL